MREGYVLIHCEAGTERQLVEQLRLVKDISEVQATLGPYDIIAKIKFDDENILSDKVTNRIRNLGNILSTETLIVFTEHEKIS
jgi:DNA-binding Lrp family transcriptional regulator